MRRYRDFVIASSFTLSILVLGSGILLWKTTAWAQPNTLPIPIQQAMDKYRLPTTGLGIFIQDVSKPHPLLTYNANKPFNPASTIKLLTTFAALDLLEPVYSWTTIAYVTGPVEQGYLQGDLILKGHGDPFLVTEYFWKFLRSLRNRGLHHIKGDLVVDNSYFARLNIDPAAFDGKPLRPYNVPPHALLLNFRTIRFNFFPEIGTERVRIVPDPNPANLHIDNELKLVIGPCRGLSKRIQVRVGAYPNENTVTFSGSYPSACGDYVLYRSVMESSSLIFGVFKTLWSEMGGTIDGRLRMGQVPKDARFLEMMTSPPLAQLIRSINKFSNNVMARQLLLTLAAEQKGTPATVQAGRDVIEEWLMTRGLNFPELVLDNGAGLSRISRLAPRSLGRLLLAAYQSPYRSEFMASLPVAGMDGTLRRRFKDSLLRGRLRMKTGTLDDVKALAGYLSSRSGRRYVVVILHNYPGVHRGAGVMVQNAILQWLFER